MPNNATITRNQLRTLFLETELGGNTRNLNRFTYAEKGSSTYTFGLLQFDVGKNGAAVKGFLKENGFGDDDIKKLSQHGGLSRTELNALDAKLQAVQQDKIDQFTNKQLDKSIAGVDDVIDRVGRQSPAAAEAISKDFRLQLGIADYENQFGPAGPQFVGFLAGKSEKLVGGTVQAGDPPTQEDLQRFINATGYGHDKANAKAVESRAERFGEAMGMLKLGPPAKAPNHISVKAGSTLQQGTHGHAVQILQADLARLGYTGHHGKPLAADGVFGPDTRHAVEHFQQDHRLTVDGKAGPLTQQAMQTALLQHTTARDLTDPRHPDHALFEQALAGVRAFDAQHDHPCTDLQRLNMAGALTVEAKREGLTRIDQVALGDSGSRIYVAQNPRSSMEQAKFGSVDTVAALQTPVAQSSATAATLPTSDQAPPTAPQPHQPSRSSLTI